MGYTPENNPYIPGDPYSYDLKWIVKKIKSFQQPEQYAAAAAASAAEALGYAERAEAAAAQTPDVPFITPEQFGAVGDGVTDDTQAFKDCFANPDIIVMLRPGKNYLISDVIPINENTTIYGNGSTITCTTFHLFQNFYPDDIASGYLGKGNLIFKDINIYGGRFSFIHGDNILIDNCHFKNCVSDHILEICACSNYTVRNCSFIGMGAGGSDYINIDPCYSTNFPWLNNAAAYDGTPNKYITVDRCIFKPGTGAFTSATTAFGVHSQGIAGLQNHDFITFTNNIVTGFTGGYAIRLNCMDHVYFAGNYVDEATAYCMEVGNWEQIINPRIVNNLFANTSATDNYFILFRAAGFTQMVFDNNDFVAPKIDNVPIYSLVPAGSGSFEKLQRMYAPSGANLPFPPTMLNKLILYRGAVASGNFHVDTIESDLQKNFVVGDVYPVSVISGTAYSVPDTITITATGFTLSGGTPTSAFVEVV